MQELVHLEQIDAYLDQTMSEEEVAAFERRLEEDPSLRAELELVKHLREGIQNHGEKVLKDKIRSTHKQLHENQFFNSTTKTITMALNQSLKWVSAAAAVVVLALGYVYFFKQEKSMPKDEFMATYMKSDNSNFDAYAEKLEAQGFAAENPIDSLVNPSLINATKYLSSGKYEDVEKELSPILETAPENAYVRYYLGRAKIELGKFAEAASILEPFETSADSLYTQFEFHDDVLFEYSKCFFQNGTAEGYDRAIAIWKKIYQDPRHKEHTLNLERIRVTEKYRDEAKQKEGK